MPNPRDFKTRAFFWQLWIGVPMLFYCILLGNSASYQYFTALDPTYPTYPLTEHTTGPFFWCRTAGITNQCFEYQKGCDQVPRDDINHLQTDPHRGNVARCNLFNAWRGFLVIAVVLIGSSWVIAIHYTFYPVKTFPSPQVSVILALLGGIAGLIGFILGESWRRNHWGRDFDDVTESVYLFGGIFSIVNWIMAFIGAPIYAKWGKDPIVNYNINN